jgi:hypothetical protein
LSRLVAEYSRKYYWSSGRKDVGVNWVWKPSDLQISPSDPHWAVNEPSAENSGKNYCMNFPGSSSESWEDDECETFFLYPLCEKRLDQTTTTMDTTVSESSPTTDETTTTDDTTTDETTTSWTTTSTQTTRMAKLSSPNHVS